MKIDSWYTHVNEHFIIHSIKSNHKEHEQPPITDIYKIIKMHVLVLLKVEKYSNLCCTIVGQQNIFFYNFCQTEIKTYTLQFNDLLKHPFVDCYK